MISKSRKPTALAVAMRPEQLQDILAEKATPGERIKGLRELLDLSQARFADTVGIKPAAIQYYEQGKLPSAKAIIKIAQRYGLSADWLLFGDLHGGPATPEELEVCTLFRELNPQYQVLIRESLKAYHLASRTRIR